MFETMMSSIREEVTDLIFKLRVRSESIDSKTYGTLTTLSIRTL
jgi:preprotein translocase subunit SecA